MVSRAYDVERMTARAPVITAIRWGAVFGGTVAGLAIYLLLELFGVATGLTAIDPTAQQPAGGVPLWTGIWTFISMLAAAFVGAWIAGRMSGLRRRMDGMLHGVVAWGLTTLVLAYLATTAAAAVIGGTMGIIGQTVQTSAQAAAGGGNQLEQMVTGTQGEANVTPQTLAALRDRLVAGDREGAVQVMTDEMGFGQDRAEQIVDGAMPLFAQDGQQVEQAAGQAVGTLTAVSWWLFATLLVSLGLAVWGGAMGARGTGKRAWGDHSDERHYIEA